MTEAEVRQQFTEFFRTEREQHGEARFTPEFVERLTGFAARMVDAIEEELAGQADITNAGLFHSQQPRQAVA